MTFLIKPICENEGHDFFISYLFQDGSRRERPLVKCFDCDTVDLVRSRQLNSKVPKKCEYCNRDMQYIYAFNNWNCWPCKSNVCYNASMMISSVEISLDTDRPRTNRSKEPLDKKTLFKYV